MAAIARRYYALAERGLWCPAESTDTLRGMVTDFRGRPLPDASIMVEYDRQERTIRTRSDADGLFELRAPSTGIDSVVVTAEGMSRHAYAVSRWEGIYVARLTRRFSDALVAEATSTNEEARLWSLLELIVSRDDEEQARLFPQLGQLRDALRALIDGAMFDAPDDRTVSPAERARRLLALWHSDEDQQLVNAWVDASDYVRRPPAQIIGSTLDEVCSEFADVHFAAEGVSTRTYHTCTSPVVDPSGGHALMTFMVRYAHWGYTIVLVLRRVDVQWRLMLEYDGTRAHYEPRE